MIRGLFSSMDPEDVERLIEDALSESTAEVSRTRQDEDDDHLAAIVVSPAFEGKSLVEQYDLVHDALGDHLTTDIHAIELTTRTPDQAASR
jgi:stress-induced morphogen